MNKENFLELRIIGLDGSDPQVLYKNRENSYVEPFDWKEYSFAFKDFNVEGFDIGGIFIGATNPGSFTLQIDNVKLGSPENQKPGN